MNKQTAVFLAALLAASPVLAMPAFNAKTENDSTKKVEAVLQQKAQAKQQQQYVKVLEGVLANGSFGKTAINANSYQEDGFRVEISLKNPKTYGDVLFAIYAPAKSQPKVKITKKYRYGVSSDPHAPIDVLMTVTLNGKTKTIAPVTAEAIELAVFVDCDYPRSSLPIKGTVGSCPRCGAADPYHCGKGHIGPCSEDRPAAKPSKPAQEVVWERQHNADCNDEYHCHCPSAVTEIKGIATLGHGKELVTKNFDGGTFKVTFSATKNGDIAYSVIPAKGTTGAKLSVSVEREPKRSSDPHEYVDINLVVKEKDAQGNVVKTTRVLIFSADASSL